MCAHASAQLSLYIIYNLTTVPPVHRSLVPHTRLYPRVRIVYGPGYHTGNVTINYADELSIVNLTLHITVIRSIDYEY